MTNVIKQYIMMTNVIELMVTIIKYVTEIIKNIIEQSITNAEYIN